MKVAFITNLCTHYRYRLFKMLSDEHGYDFFFFDDEQKTKEDIRHLKIFKEGERFYYLSTKKIFWNILRNKPNVIIKCTTKKWIFIASLLLSKLVKAKFIVWHTIWNYPSTVQYRFFSRLLIKILKDFADAIVVYGDHGKRFLQEKGISSDKIYVAWQTVDNDLFGRDVKRGEVDSLKKTLNISKNKKIILYVGRFVEIKGIEYLLDALNKLRNNKFIFLLIGFGNLRDYIKEYCEKKEIDYHIVGLISYDELPPYYKMADVLVLPSVTTKSFKETWGLVVNEAFNQGCPAIVTDAVGAGVGGLVIDGFNGFVVPERDANALADAIENIVMDEQLRMSMGNNAYREIKKWTYERQVEGFLNAVDYVMRENYQEPSVRVSGDFPNDSL